MHQSPTDCDAMTAPQTAHGFGSPALNIQSVSRPCVFSCIHQETEPLLLQVGCLRCFGTGSTGTCAPKIRGSAAATAPTRQPIFRPCRSTMRPAVTKTSVPLPPLTSLEAQAMHQLKNYREPGYRPQLLLRYRSSSPRVLGALAQREETTRGASIQSGRVELVICSFVYCDCDEVRNAKRRHEEEISLLSRLAAGKHKILP
ncbi:hypothetical protein ACQKWADRAFT_121668 [Trichoderma austrokoningii]